MYERFQELLCGRGETCSSDVVSDPHLCKYYVRAAYDDDQEEGENKVRSGRVRGFHYGI